MTIINKMAESLSAVHMVKTAVYTVLKESTSLTTERSAIFNEAGRKFIQLLEDDTCNNEVEEFCFLWTESLRKIVEGTSSILKSSDRDRMWKKFFKHKTEKLNDMWMKFLSQPSVSTKMCVPDHFRDPLLVQTVDRCLFEAILKREVPLNPTAPVETPLISSEEQNAIRYAAGYVLRSIRIKLMKCNSSSSNALMNFVDTLHVESHSEQNEETYLEYTKRWINKVN